MIENKPSIYNAPSVYNQGGGGGGELVEIGGFEYKVISIGPQKWLDRNLSLEWPGLTINPASQTDTQFCAYKDLGHKCAIGISYNKAAVQYLVANQNLLNGFKVPSENDIDQLISFVGDPSKLCNDVWGGSNEFGFNLIPCGYYVSSLARWDSENIAHLATSNYDADFLRIKNIKLDSVTYEDIHKFTACSVRLILA